MKITGSILSALVIANTKTQVEGWIAPSSYTTRKFTAGSHALTPSSAPGPTSTSIFGRKKGKLSQNVSSSSSGVSTKTRNKSKKGKQNKKTSGADNEPVISSSLSSWATSLRDDGNGGEEGSQTSSVTASASKVDSTSFQPFTDDSTNVKSKSGSTRRERSLMRQQEDAVKNAEIQSILSSIKDIISSNNLSIPDLLAQITSLATAQSPTTLKALLKGSNIKGARKGKESLSDYNLAWVGSDEAICHIGTGLHKVPLARLQDIFLSIGRDAAGTSESFRLMEIIRILGPFPNVRNTLQGSVDKMSASEGKFGGGVVQLDNVCIKYDSMTDGLGKEINAGTEDNLRFVDLNVIYADDNALVCVVPSSDNGAIDLGNNGENVLLFLSEDDLDYKLEELRVA